MKYHALPILLILIILAACANESEIAEKQTENTKEINNPMFDDIYINLQNQIDMVCLTMAK